MTININTILHTKDGRKIGNAIITGRDGYFWEVTTDYGSKKMLTSQEIDKLFYIAYSDFTIEFDGMTPEEAQAMQSETHKHRVKL